MCNFRQMIGRLAIVLLLQSVSMPVPGALCQTYINGMHVTNSQHILAIILNDPATELDEATTALQTLNANCSDVRCCIQLSSPTGTGTFGTTTDNLYRVESNAELALVQAFVNPNVKIVEVLQDCCGAIGVLHGCTILGSRTSSGGGNQNTVIAGNAEGAVWAHEFGHAQNINHYSSTCTALIMRTPTSTTANAVIGSECTTMRTSPSVTLGQCSAVFPDAINSYFVPQSGPTTTPSEGNIAIRNFRACPNNDGGASLPQQARIKVVLRDISNVAIEGVAAADICVVFNGGTPAQGYGGLGADSVIANSTWNTSPLCPSLQCIPADGATDATGTTHITFGGVTRDYNRKWGHYDWPFPAFHDTRLS
jgi:hypothetical protein